MAEEINARIYQGSGDLFYYDTHMGKWRVFLKGIYSGRHQYVAFGKSVLVGYNLNEHEEMIVPLESERQSISVGNISFMSVRCLSPDEGELAFSGCIEHNACSPILRVIDLDENTVVDYPRITNPDSISWSFDGNRIYAAFDNDVYEVCRSSGQVRAVGTGYWVKVISDNEIAYWRNEGSCQVCLSRNLRTSTETELFRTNLYLLSADWDPTGRYVVVLASASVHKFLFLRDYVCLPLIWDTQSKEFYKLPVLRKIKGGGVYWR